MYVIKDDLHVHVHAYNTCTTCVYVHADWLKMSCAAEMRSKKCVFHSHSVGVHKISYFLVHEVYSVQVGRGFNLIATGKLIFYNTTRDNIYGRRGGSRGGGGGVGRRGG